MDINYSQFVTMYPELLVLAVFIIVLLVDIFFGKKAQKALTPITPCALRAYHSSDVVHTHSKH